jgi:hypothetical protein
MKIEYPKWIYHKDHAAKIVMSSDEWKSNGSGWVESPSEANIPNSVVSDPVELLVEQFEAAISSTEATQEVIKRRPGRPKKNI